MRIGYDRRAKIAGIGIMPWPRLGLERWFEDYKIASYYGWGPSDMSGQLPSLLSMASQGGLPQLKRLNTAHLLAEPVFQKLLVDNLSGYSIITYRPTEIPEVLTRAGCKFIGLSLGLTTKLENKVLFRQMLSEDRIPFPAYKILDRNSIDADDKSLENLLAENDAVVLQDESLSGGQGTFIIRNLDDLKTALKYLDNNRSSGQLVISEYIEHAGERTIQCCVTKYGIFIGPLQKQIVADPLLANLNVVGAGRYCGAEITPNDHYAGAYPEIRDYAKRIGHQIQSMGYRGIFGMDCLVSDDGSIYILEINPRLTGITPLLTALYREGQDIPFYLLHTLELAGLEYSIDDSYVNPNPPEGGLMVLHSWSTKLSHSIDLPSPGLYDTDKKILVSRTARFDNSSTFNQMLVQPMSLNADVKPGARLLLAFTNGRILDDNDQLLPRTVDNIDWLKKQTVLKE